MKALWEDGVVTAPPNNSQNSFCKHLSNNYSIRQSKSGTEEYAPATIRKMFSEIEEELFYVYYRLPRLEDLVIRWMSASAILSYISTYGRLQVSDRSLRALVKILERDGLRKRLTENNIWEYEVMQKDFHEVERNFKSVSEEIRKPQRED